MSKRTNAEDTMAELSDDVHERIQALCKKGDSLADRGRYPAALEQYWAAWDLLPEPKTEWQAATWILAAVGDANFLGENYAAGRDNLTMAMHCPEAIGNPFLHLRLGQCHYKLATWTERGRVDPRLHGGGGRGLRGRGRIPGVPKDSASTAARRLVTGEPRT
jgi:hypothetical protein